MFCIQHMICFFFTLLVIKAAVITATEIDWKYALGWDGVISDPRSIGTPKNATASADYSIDEQRAPGGVYLCENSDWHPSCRYTIQPIGVCINLGHDWEYSISSIGPDPGTKVVGYSKWDCQTRTRGDALVFVYPGTDELGPVYNNVFVSIMALSDP